YGTKKMRRIFSSENLVQKWLDVEAAIAKSQAHLNIIPFEASEEINNKAKVNNINLKRMGEEIERASHTLVPFIRQFTEICDNGYGEYIHWGATTQDIMDTATVLQLKEVVAIIEEDIKKLQNHLINITINHKHTVLPGRTHGQ